MKVLATSDIHLGRKPTHRESSLEGWDAVIKCAISEAVDVLLLVGDVIEHERAWMGVYGPLTEGLKKLANASIKVIAVGGNHDWEIFPRLVKEREEIVVLGSDGNWQSYDYLGVRFVGRSFASTHDQANPMESFDPQLLEGSSLSLGLLHTDVGNATSPYAPTSANDFLSSEVELWVLGHIHKPGFVVEDKAFYCGSPFSLDPAERGSHGVYILEQDGQAGWKSPRFLPLSPIRYEQVEVAITSEQSIGDIQESLTSQVRFFAQECAHHGELYLDLHFTGTRDEAISLPEVVGAVGLEGYFLEVDQTKVIIRSYTDTTVLPVDLTSLSKSGGIDGILARLIIDEEKIVELYRRLNKESFNSPAFRALKEAKLDHQALSIQARRAALRLLESMVRQREEG